ncbi:helicase-related protein [Rhodohalobacter halophilus]|uniref:helicase-related protein n=1 Tax=Rhodohalobacter halophilus TaxID=1812810 RepID=UPI00083FA418|nr:DEAD/DEAH box helicase [Rhodohalobacter halophilus]
MSFNQFRLSSDILKGLKDVKIESPSPLQKKIYKAVQEGSDLVINTTIEDKPEIGYLLNLLNEISKTDRRQGTKGIILAPDEERAKFLDEWIWAIGYHASIESACITGKGDPKEQLQSLSAGPVVVVATPKEFSEVLEEGKMIFREVQQLIVDQAEKVEDWDAVEAISTRVISKCQRVFTAAKDSKELREAEGKLLTDPQLVTLAKKTSAKKKEAEPEITKDLTQYYINVPPRSKISTLMAHLDKNKTDTVVIFTASRRTADRLYKILRKSNRRAVSVHDQLNKETFEERFNRFTTGDVQHLIVGDMSANDLPLEHATQVINYDVPEDVNEYKLRAELVGDGKATRILSLVSKQDREDINEICKSLGYAPEEVPLPKSVKEKVSSNKKGKGKRNQRGRGKSKSRSSKGSKGRGRPKRSKKDQGGKHHGLPRPTFDQLEGGRTGKKKEEKKGVVGFFKKLFS